MIYRLPQIIETAADSSPDKVAFRCRDMGLTYAGLLMRANQLANTLIDLGVRKGDRVGIFLPKSLESVIAVYGIMQAGAAYVPLDPKLPAARLELIVRDCELSCVITGQRQAPTLRQLAPDCGLLHVIGVADPAMTSFHPVSWDQVTAASTTTPAVVVMEQDMAYLMYTSGSTGAPKGMVHTHASGLSYAGTAAAVYGLRADDRLSDFPPLHFDQSTFGLFSGPLAQATTVVIPEEHMLLPASLSQLMADEQLTVWYSVPFALVQLHLRGALDQRDMRALRWVLYGGEAFPLKYLRGLMAQWPHARFSNVYGPAEVNQCTVYHFSTLDQGAETVPIGAVWPNAEGLIVDADDNPVADGQPGELLVRTPTMMQGYWRRPELNARAFYLPENASGLSERYYRTGDLVLRQADGQMLFLGRTDRQIKARGFRIELDEVEAALLAHPGVEEAAAFPLPLEDGSQAVHAAVIAKPGADLGRNVLLTHLLDRLPRYAIPADIAVRIQFPRTGSGKIDRNRLRELALAPDNGSSAGPVPVNGEVSEPAAG